MNSFERRYYLQNPTWWRHLRRDLHMLLDDIRFLYLWATLGGRVRRACRRADMDKDPVILEDLFGDDGP